MAKFKREKENEHTKYLYRYIDVVVHPSVHLKLERYPVVKETDYYCWYPLDPCWPISEAALDHAKAAGRIKKMKKGSARSYCHETKREALNSYMHRKFSQAGHLQIAVAKNEMAIKFLQSAPFDELVKLVEESPYPRISLGVHKDLCADDSYEDY